MASLRLEQRQAAVAGLAGKERQREYMRLSSGMLREGPAFRKADNAAKAQHGREAYHANLERACPVIQISRSVRYDPVELSAWIERRKTRHA